MLGVKSNLQPRYDCLWDTWDLERVGAFADGPHDFAQTVSNGHGWVEIRRCWALGNSEYLPSVDPEGQWPDLHSLCRVEAERRVEDPAS